MADVTVRHADLRQMLSERRRRIQDDVLSRMRHGRADRSNDVADTLERSDADIQEGIEFSLLQMRAETLTQIDDALLRLDAGQYGSCFECESEIAAGRLRALPFAVRCQLCEERRERAQGDATRRAPHRDSSFFTAALTF